MARRPSTRHTTASRDTAQLPDFSRRFIAPLLEGSFGVDQSGTPGFSFDHSTKILIVGCAGLSVSKVTKRLRRPRSDFGTRRTTVTCAVPPGSMLIGRSRVVTHTQSEVPPISRTGSVVQLRIATTAVNRS